MERRKHGSSAFRRHSRSFTFISHGSDREIGFHPGISLVDPGDAAVRWTLAHMSTMVAPDPFRPTRSVGEVLGTVRLPDALSEILASHFRTVCEEG